MAVPLTTHKGICVNMTCNIRHITHILELEKSAHDRRCNLELEKATAIKTVTLEKLILKLKAGLNSLYSFMIAFNCDVIKAKSVQFEGSF